MILVTHFACCHQYKGYWPSCPLGWSYFTVMPGLNLRAGGAHAPEFTPAQSLKASSCMLPLTSSGNVLFAEGEKLQESFDESKLIDYGSIEEFQMNH